MSASDNASLPCFNIAKQAVRPSSASRLPALRSGGIMWPFKRPRATVDSKTTPSEPWKPDELNLRRREVAAAEAGAKSQVWIQLVQALSVVVALASTVVALITARQSAAATNAATEISTEQSAEGQLASAISAISTGSISARITSMLLVQRDIQGIISLQLSTNGARQNAYNDYTTVLSVYSVYIHNYTPSASDTFGPGYGIPASNQIPLDITYAASEMRQLLLMAYKAIALYSGSNTLYSRSSSRPVLDLSNGELYGQSWPEVDFSRVFTYMPRADLRGAYLVNSKLENAYLAGSYLQCADLRGADLRGANLIGADLRGADVQGAIFLGASLKRANLGQLYGSAIGLPASHNVSRSIPDTTACLHNQAFWDKPMSFSISP